MINSLLDFTICPKCKKTHLNCVCGTYNISSTKQEILSNTELIDDDIIFEFDDKLIALGYDFEDCKFNIYDHCDKWTSMLCVLNHGEINLSLSLDEFNKLNPLLQKVYISALNKDCRYIMLIDLNEL